MESNSVKLPLYLKLSQTVLGIAAFFYVLYLGQDILIPLIFATIFAILLNPVVNFLTNKKLNRILAIAVTVITALALLAALLYFIGTQISMFSDSIPEFKKQFESFYADTVNWVSQTFNIQKSKIDQWLNKIKSEGSGNGTAIIGQTLGTIGGIFALTFLIPVYIFMILFYKPLLLDFISQLFSRSKQKVVAEVLMETRGLIQSYLIGLLIEAAIIATLNSVGLLLIGVKYAILLGILSAILNIIPYIGGLVATGLAMLMGLLSGDTSSALYVLLLYLVVQFADNNFIVPKIVASKVKVNALVSIIIVLIGGALWGIAGMFLSIPLIAICKVVFDRVEDLQPFGFLIGDNQPEVSKQIFNFKEVKKRTKARITSTKKKTSLAG